MRILVLRRPQYSSRHNRSARAKARHRGRARALPKVPARYLGISGILIGQGLAAVAPAAVQVAPAAVQEVPAAMVPVALGDVVNSIVR